MYNNKSAAGLTPSTVEYIHIALHAALKQALKNQLVTRNVTDGTTRPQVKKSEITPLSRGQINQFLAAIRKDKLYPSILLSIMTGCRRGELLGAQWSDIDLDAGIWRVRRSLARVKNHSRTQDAPKTRLLVQEPKTEKGKRTLPLAPEVIDALRRLKAAQAQERLLMGEAYTDQGLIFCQPDGMPLSSRTLLRQFQQKLTYVGLPQVRLHDLRHSFATPCSWSSTSTPRSCKRSWATARSVSPSTSIATSQWKQGRRLLPRCRLPCRGDGNAMFPVAVRLQSNHPQALPSRSCNYLE